MRAHRLLVLLALGILALSVQQGGAKHDGDLVPAICCRTYAAAGAAFSLSRQPNGYAIHELKFGHDFFDQDFLKHRRLRLVDNARPGSIAVSMPISRSPPA